jgi:acetyl esterase/lipase
MHNSKDGLAATLDLLSGLAAGLAALALWLRPAAAQSPKTPPEAKSKETTTPKVKVPEGLTYHEDLVYHTPEPKKPLLLDVARPAQGKGPFPTALVIHGGGLTGGRVEVRPHAFALAQKGYVAVLVGYRHQPEHCFPTPLDDVLAALRWLRKNAATYQVDTARIGVVGHSTGGGIGCLMAMNSAKGKIQVNHVLKTTSKQSGEHPPPITNVRWTWGT